MAENSRTASQFLDMACAAENDGNHAKASLALKAALTADEREHRENPKTASLPRR